MDNINDNKTRQLPTNENQPTDRVWAGYGKGLPCDFCSHSIARHEVEYEVELAAVEFAAAQDGSHVLRFHLTCFQTWSTARQADLP